jgi:hypothetical protein
MDFFPDTMAALKKTQEMVVLIKVSERIPKFATSG